MKLKKGVKLMGIRPELIIALIIAEGIYLKKGKELVITSINDGKHAQTSSHYSGNGADLRKRYFTKKQQLEVFKTLKENLKNDYFVKLESDHIHIQYQPRR